jgi:hypothetical protein
LHSQPYANANPADANQKAQVSEILRGGNGSVTTQAKGEAVKSTLTLAVVYFVG